MPRRPGRAIAVLGTGLIGTSFGLALRARGERARIIGWDPHRAHLRQARARRAIDAIAPSPEAAVAEAEIIIVAVPIEAALALVPRIVRTAPAGSLVLDVASLKGKLLAAVARGARESKASFVGGHPLAGKERTGPRHADARLFAGRPFALCAMPGRRGQAALRRAAVLVRRLGAIPCAMDAAAHDRIVAATSALPQVVSSALVLAAMRAGARAADLIGPGFESTARLAGSGPLLWRNLLLQNKQNVGPLLRVFESRVRDFRRAVESNDVQNLSRLLRLAALQLRRLQPARTRSRCRRTPSASRRR